MRRRRQFGSEAPTYGAAYRAERERVLAGGPLCHWCGVRPATTADHEPPVYVAGWHLNLLPACGPCNYGRRGLCVRASVPPSRSW